MLAEYIMTSQKPPSRLPTGIPSVRESLSYNWHTLRSNVVGEVAGSLGDMGTLLPLLTAMTAAGNIDLTATLIFSGIFNFLSGSIYGVPIVVQPMKAIAGIAISRPLTLHETTGAGLSVAGIVLILSITGLLSWLGTRIPIPLVKGIQMGAGLSLILNAGTQIAGLTWASHWADNYSYLLIAFLLLCGTSRMHKFPYALLLFICGIVIASVVGHKKFPSPAVNLPKFNPPGEKKPFILGLCRV